jgi:hypothetical protein
MTQPDPSAQSGATDPQSGVGNGGSDGTSIPPVDPAQSGGSATPPTNPAEPDSTEAAKYRERMQAADRRAATLEQELKQLRDKDLPEAEKLKRDHEQALADLAAARDQNKQLAIGNTFLLENTYDWHDPKAALGMLDRSRLEVADDGTVSGMKTALKALADANGWMIKPKADPQNPGAVPVGVPPINGQGAPAVGNSKQELKSRFPGLRSKLGG